jgi:hypothetical protein
MLKFETGEIDKFERLKSKQISSDERRSCKEDFLAPQPWM